LGVCVVCINYRYPATSDEVPLEKRQACLCQNHGTNNYSENVECIFCKSIEPIPTGGSSSSGKDPLPLYISNECWLASGGTE
jgi:hypothetical protein